jgi:hypothetical protein
MRLSQRRISPFWLVGLKSKGNSNWDHGFTDASQLRAKAAPTAKSHSYPGKGGK